MSNPRTALLTTQKLGIRSLVNSLRLSSKAKIVENFDDLFLHPKIQKQMENLSNYFSNFCISPIITEGQVTSFVISPDKSSFYYGTKEGRLIGLEIKTKEIVFDIDLKSGPITVICITPDGSSLNIGFVSGDIIHFSISKKNALHKVLAHRGGVNHMCMSINSELFSAGNDGRVSYWKQEGEEFEQEELYRHTSRVFAVDIDADAKYVVSGGKDKILKIYSLAEEGLLKEIEDPEAGIIKCVKITAKNKFLAFGDSNGKLFLYDFDSFKKIQSFEAHHGRIKCLESSENEANLFSGGKDGKVLAWSTSQKLRDPVLINKNHGAIRQILVFKENLSICTISSRKCIQTWGIPRFTHYFIIRPQKEVSRFFTIYPENTEENNFFLISNEKIIKISESGESRYSLSLYAYDSKIIAYNSVKNLFCIASCDSFGEYKKSIYSFTYHTGLRFEATIAYEKKCYGIYSMIFSNEGNYLIIGESYRCTIVVANTFEKYCRFMLTKNPIVYMAQSYLDHYLITSAEDTNRLKLLNLNLTDSFKFFEHQSFESIKKIVFTDDDEFFIVLPENKEITVWLISKKIKVHTILNTSVVDINFNHTHRDLYLLRNHNLECLSFPSLCRRFLVKFDEVCSTFCFRNFGSEFVCLMQSKIEVWTVPNENRGIAVYGENRRIYEFCEFIGKMISRKKLEAENEFNSWIIEPFHMNTSHIYAYMNKKKLLIGAIMENSGYAHSTKNISPLDICLELNREKGITVIVNFLTSKIKDNPFISCVLMNSINSILIHESSKCKELLEIITPRTLTMNIPEFDLKNSSTITFSDFLLEERQLAKQTSNSKIPAEYLQSYYKINFKTGSEDSINFFKSLYFTKNDDTYKSKFVQTILEYKWSKVKIVLLIQSLIYIAYLVLFSLYSVYSSIQVLYAAFAFNVLLIFYEIIQFFSAKIDYLIDGWNYVDIARSVLMTYMFFSEVIDNQNTDNETAFAIFLSLVKGISYFRMSKHTRYYIRLIYKVLEDIVPFLIILFYSTISYTLIFHRISQREGKFTDYMSQSWEINLGAFDTTGYGNWAYLAFAFYCLFNPIVMLTLLVSIMGDTYATVSEGLIVAEGHELCGMILEAEFFYVWRRKDINKAYMHIYRIKERNEEEEKEKESEKKSKIKKAQKRIFENNVVNVEKGIAGLKDDMKGIKGMIEGIEGVIKTIIEKQENVISGR